jgi:hypothetical protein
VLCIEPVRVIRVGRGDAFGRDSDAFLGLSRWDYARQADGTWSFDSAPLGPRAGSSRGLKAVRDGEPGGTVSA